MKTKARMTPLRLALMVIALFAAILAISFIPRRVQHQLDAFEYRISDPSENRPTTITMDGWLQTPLFFPWSFRGKLLVGGYEQLAQAGENTMDTRIRFDQFWPGKYDGSIAYMGYSEDLRPMGNNFGFLRMTGPMKRLYIGVYEPVGASESAFDGSSGLIVLAPATTLEEAQALHEQMLEGPK